MRGFLLAERSAVPRRKEEVPDACVWLDADMFLQKVEQKRRPQPPPPVAPQLPESGTLYRMSPPEVLLRLPAPLDCRTRSGKRWRSSWQQSLMPSHRPERTTTM